MRMQSTAFSNRCGAPMGAQILAGVRINALDSPTIHHRRRVRMRSTVLGLRRGRASRGRPSRTYGILRRSATWSYRRSRAVRTLWRIGRRLRRTTDKPDRRTTPAGRRFERHSSTCRRNPGMSSALPGDDRCPSRADRRNTLRTNRIRADSRNRLWRTIHMPSCRAARRRLRPCDRRPMLPLATRRPLPRSFLPLQTRVWRSSFSLPEGIVALTKEPRASAGYRAKSSPGSSGGPPTALNLNFLSPSKLTWPTSEPPSLRSSASTLPSRVYLPLNSCGFCLA